MPKGKLEEIPPSDRAIQLVNSVGKEDAYTIANFRYGAARSEERRRYWNKVAVEIVKIKD